jgi:hypothetical protein
VALPSPTYKVLIDWDQNGNYTGTYDDVTADVVGDIIIDRGRSDLHGSLSVGSLSFSLWNRDKKYSPQNSSSPIFGKVYPYRDIQIQVIYDSTTYYRFTGQVKSFKPSPDRVNPTVAVYAEDRLSQLQKQEVSKSITAPETYDDMVEAVLLQAGLTAPEFVIDTIDDAIDQNRVFTDRFVSDILAEIAEAGHHFFFVDGQGRVNFRDRHWALNADSFETYHTDEDHAKTLNRPCTMSWDDEEVINDMRVIHTVDKTASNTNSQTKYGIRSHEINNDTVKNSSATHAQNLASYWVEVYREIVWLGSVVIENLFPDVVSIEPGVVVTIVDDQLDLNTRFLVMGLNETITVKTGDHFVTMRIQEETDFSLGSVSAIYPTVGVMSEERVWQSLVVGTPRMDYNGLEGYSMRSRIMQQFKGERGLLDDFILRLKSAYAGTQNHNIIIRIYELDGAGLPTGSPLFNNTYVKSLTNAFQNITFAGVTLAGFDLSKDYGIMAYSQINHIDTISQTSSDSNQSLNDVAGRQQLAQIIRNGVATYNNCLFLAVADTTFRIRRVGTPSDLRFLITRLKYDSGLGYNTPDMANVYYTSDWFPYTDFGTSYANYTHYPRSVIDGELAVDGFAIVWECSGSVDAANYYEFRADSGNPYGNGVAHRWNGSSWIRITGTDLYFISAGFDAVEAFGIEKGPDPYLSGDYHSYPNGDVGYLIMDTAVWTIDPNYDLYFQLEGW